MKSPSCHENGDRHVHLQLQDCANKQLVEQDIQDGIFGQPQLAMAPGDGSKPRFKSRHLTFLSISLKPLL